MYIHSKPNWPNFVWDADILLPKLTACRHKEGQLLGRMQSLGFELRTEASLSTLTSDVVRSSAIEGEVLNQDEVRSSIARHLGLDTGGLMPAGPDVDGVVEMMLDATQHYDRALTEERLFAWHAALFPTGRSGLRWIQVGGWRTGESGPMQVVSGPIGRERVHFEAPEADRLPAEMAGFLDWFNAGLNDATMDVGEPFGKPVDGLDPVLKAGIAHFYFVTLHPFEDGNGRIARAIADMALARADASAERFYSMSSQIAKERKNYYQSLEKHQRGGLDITGWLVWFVDCLGRAIASAEETLAVVLYKSKLWQQANRYLLNDRQTLIIKRMLNGFKGHMNTSKYAKLAKCSTDTALRDILGLVDKGLMIRNPGGGRSTSYRLVSAEELNENGGSSLAFFGIK